MKARMYLLLNLQYETPNTPISPSRYLAFNFKAGEEAPSYLPICLSWSAELSYPNTLAGAQRTDLSCWPFLSPLAFYLMEFHPTKTWPRSQRREKPGKGRQRYIEASRTDAGRFHRIIQGMKASGELVQQAIPSARLTRGLYQNTKDWSSL